MIRHRTFFSRHTRFASGARQTCPTFLILRYPETTYGSGALFTWGWGELRFSKVTATVAVTSMPQVAVVKGGGVPGDMTAGIMTKTANTHTVRKNK